MGNIDDFQGFERRLQNELERLDQFDERDRQHVKRWVQRNDGRIKDSTMAEYLKNLRATAKRLDQPIVTLTEPDFEAAVYDWRRNPEYGQGEGGLSQSTIRNVEFVVRKFLTDLELAEWPEDYELSPPEDTSVRPEDMLRTEDIKALREGANNLRDIALIEFLADTGARLSLVGSLRVGDVDFDGKKATYRPNPNARGLKDADITDYPIIDARAILRTYLNQVHPRPDRDDVALFHRLPGHGNDVDEDKGALSPETIRGQLRAAADRAGVDKPVNPHNFRHSAVTRMAREGYTRSQIEHRVHWEVDTDMWSTYEHIRGQEHNEDIFAQAGIEEAESGEEPTRKPCGNCREPLAPHHEYCPRCGEPATPAAEQAHEAVEDSAIKDLQDSALTARERKIVGEVLEEIRRQPDRTSGLEPRDHDDPSSTD